MTWHILADSFFDDTAADFFARFPRFTCRYDPDHVPIREGDVLVYLGLVFDAGSMATHLLQIRKLLRPPVLFANIRIVLFSCFDPVGTIQGTPTRQDIQNVIDAWADIAELCWLGFGGDGKGFDGEMIRCVLATLEYINPEPVVLVFANESDRHRWQPHADFFGRPCMLLSPGLPWRHRHVLFVDYTGKHIQEFADMRIRTECTKSIYLPFMREILSHCQGISHVLYHCALPYLNIPIIHHRFVKLFVSQLFVRPVPVEHKTLVVLSSADSETRRAICALFDGRVFDVYATEECVRIRNILRTFQTLETEHPEAAAFIVESRTVVNNQVQTRFAIRFRDDKPVLRITHPEQNFIPSLDDARLTAWVTIPPMPLDKHTIDLFNLTNGTADPITCYRMVTERADISDAAIYFRLTNVSKAWAIHQGFHAL